MNEELLILHHVKCNSIHCALEYNNNRQVFKPKIKPQITADDQGGLGILRWNRTIDLKTTEKQSPNIIDHWPVSINLMVGEEPQ